MTETQLKKLQLENARLQSELEMLQDAKTTLEACETLVQYMQAKDEPLLLLNNPASIWHATPNTVCCTIS